MKLFNFWAEILFVTKTSMEMGNRMESILFFSLGFADFLGFFLRKG